MPEDFAAFETAPPLPDWLRAEIPFRRRIFRNGGYQVHFVDEGEGPVVLLLHGNPTWAYLWRKVIHRLLAAGMRVIAPDLIGLGFSSKPRNLAVHTLAFHGKQLSALVSALELQDITIAGQDWGGPITGAMAALRPARVSGAVFANTAIWQPQKPPPVSTFHRFANLPIISDFFFRILNGIVPAMPLAQGDPRSVGLKELRAYWYPLRHLRDRAGPLAFARMVPTTLSHPTIVSLGEVDAWARAFGGPVHLVWGTRDPVLGPALKGMRRLFPDAPVTTTAAGHFLQEEVPDELATAIMNVVQTQKS